jgi:hypothetical protein
LSEYLNLRELRSASQKTNALFQSSGVRYGSQA